MEIIDPFFKGVFGYTVEVVHLQNVILWVEVADGINVELLSLERA